MSWLYTREAGNDGQVITHEGEPEGAPLTRFLHEGPMPIRAGLELIALLADILTIAEEDDAVHGGIQPAVVYIGAAGEVTIAGYGVSRHSVGALEEQQVRMVSDIHGLGLLLHAVLSSGSMGAVPRERRAHDRAMMKGLSSIDWGGLRDKSWWAPVLQFLCSMVSFEPESRPEPLDVANLLSEVAAQAPGQPLETWAQQAIALNRRSIAPKRGPRTPRRVAAKNYAERAETKPSGDVRSEAASFSRRKGALTKGQCTGFWTHQKISDLLVEDTEEAVPPVGRGGRTLPSPPSVPPLHEKRMKAEGRRTERRASRKSARMSSEETNDVQPSGPEHKESLRDRFTRKRPTSGPGQPRRRFASGDAPSPWASSLRESVNSWFGVMRASGAQLSRAREADLAPANEAADPVPFEPVAPESRDLEPASSEVNQTDQNPPVSSGATIRPLPWVSISLGIGSINVLVGLVVVVGAIFMVKHRAMAEKEQPNAAPEQQEVIGENVQTAAESAALTKTTATRSRTRSTSGPRGRSKAKRASTSRGRSPARSTPTGPTPPRTRSSTSPAGTAGGFVVRFRSLGQEARLVCGDGQTAEFSGATRRRFQSVTTCRVTIQGASTVVQVNRESSITCVPSAGVVRCTRA